MKVFAFLPCFLSSAGCGVNERRLIRGLTLNSSVMVLAVGREGCHAQFSDSKQLDLARTKVLPLSKYSKPAFLFDLFYGILLSITFVVFRLVGKKIFDVIYVRGASEAIGFSLLRKLHGIPVVLKLMSFRSDEYFMGKRNAATDMVCQLLFLLEKIAAAKSDAVIVPSALFRAEVVHRFGIPKSKVSTLGVGVDLDLFSSKPNDCDQTVDQTVTIGYVGSLIPLNDVDTLLQAFKIAKATLNVRLLILTRDDSAVLKNQIGLMNLGEFVEIKSVPHEEVPHCMLDIDIVAIPRRRVSSTEMVIPLKLLEAGAAKKPTIIARTRIIKHTFVDTENVLMYEPEDPKDLSDKIFLLCADVKLRDRLGNSLFNFAENFDWHVIVRKFRNQLYSAASVYSKR
jgi:glycosyltransferase involved in cell wall biosynthesis